MSDSPFEVANESDLPSPKEIRAALNKLDVLLHAKANTQAIGAAIEEIPFANMQLLRLGVTSIPSVYRATSQRDGMDDTLLTSFGMPPKEVVRRGRANLEGHPVLYCSLQEDTAIQEVLHKYPQSEVGQLIYLSRWKPRKPANIKQLIYPGSIVHGEVAHAFVDSATEAWAKLSRIYSKARSEALLVLWRKMGAYFLDPNESYPVSAYLGHEALYGFNPPGGYQVDILAYPSFAKEHEGVNFAVSPRFTEYLELEEVRKYRIGRRNRSGSDVTLLAVGKPEDRHIHWNRIKILKDFYKPIQARMQTSPEEGILYQSESLNVGDKNIALTNLFASAWQHLGPMLKAEVRKRMLRDLVEETDRYLTLTTPLQQGPFHYEGRQVQRVQVELTVKYGWKLLPVASAMDLT